MYVILGWILDRLFGDPSGLPHPIVLFGRCISVAEKWLNRGRYKVIKGAMVAVVLILSVYMITYGIVKWVSEISPIWGNVVCVIGVFFSLGGKTLSKEVKMVFESVDRSVEEGRKQVARIVGRDTTELSPQEIRAAALETLAENLSDGVVAPLFWCACLGVPGMLAYKMVNTLDSMIGYKNERYIEFGRLAAQIDDLANYIPARITAFMMAMVAPLCGSKGIISHLRFIGKYGNKHLSPNSGYPEAALASILQCRFGGPHHYFGKEVYKPFIGHQHKIFTANDMHKSLQINLYSEIVAVILVALVVGV